MRSLAEDPAELLEAHVRQQGSEGFVSHSSTMKKQMRIQMRLNGLRRWLSWVAVHTRLPWRSLLVLSFEFAEKPRDAFFFDFALVVARVLIQAPNPHSASAEVVAATEI